MSALNQDTDLTYPSKSTRGYAAVSRGLHPLAETTPSRHIRHPPAGRKRYGGHRPPHR